MDTEGSIAWARAEAQRLGAQHSRSPAAAVEFLRTHAGTASSFFLEASKIQGVDSYVNPRVARTLKAFADFLSDGLGTAPLQLTLRMEAATDLMEQVQLLLDDRKVHPAAPVVLAGAALEEFLRGLLATTTEELSGRGLDAYASALRRAELVDVQDVKNITMWAGLRNAAAHGEFDRVSLEEARIMALGINLFLQQNG